MKHLKKLKAREDVKEQVEKYDSCALAQISGAKKDKVPEYVQSWRIRVRRALLFCGVPITSIFEGHSSGVDTLADLIEQGCDPLGGRRALSDYTPAGQVVEKGR